MEQHPKVSVVIPAFNEEHYLPQCLESIKKQTFKDFEIVVVDNNSTDKTAEVAKQYGARVVCEPVQGMTPARERGFKEAKAEIIARTDADIIVPPHWLETIYQAFLDHPDVVAVTGGINTPTRRLPHHIFDVYSQMYVRLCGTMIAGYPLLFGPNMGIRKSQWQRVHVHMNDKEVHEDIDLAYHMSKIGRILYLPNLTVKYSLRRLKKRPMYTTYEYIHRYFNTMAIHRKEEWKRRLQQFAKIHK